MNKPDKDLPIKLVIVAVACYVDGKIYTLPAPNRHHHVIYHYGIKTSHPDEQGFLNGEGDYIRRKAAKVLAVRSGQYLTDEQYKAKHGLVGPAHEHISRYRGDELFSEDLW